MLSDAFSQSWDTLESEPQEMGIEGISQIKGDDQKKQKKKQDDIQKRFGDKNLSDKQRQQYINDLYGVSDNNKLPLEQMSDQDLMEMKRQRSEQLRKRYEQLQQEIQQYRAKKQQEKSEYEIGMQKGTEAARTAQEEQELWQKEQEKAKKQKKDEEQARLPGSAQSRSGEQGKVMG